jgi:hypothetical protein
VHVGMRAPLDALARRAAVAGRAVEAVERLRDLQRVLLFDVEKRSDARPSRARA